MLDILDDVETWMQSVFMLGLRSVSDEMRQRAVQLIQELRSSGFESEANALDQVVRREGNDAYNAFGRLVVIHQLTREAATIERLARD